MNKNQIIHFLLLKEMKEKNHIQQSKWTVQNVDMMKQFGGCFKQEALMNLQPDFIVAKNANTLGVITHNV